MLQQRAAARWVVLRLATNGAQNPLNPGETKLGAYVARNGPYAIAISTTAATTHQPMRSSQGSQPVRAGAVSVSETGTSRGASPCRPATIVMPITTKTSITPTNMI